MANQMEEAEHSKGRLQGVLRIITAPLRWLMISYLIVRVVRHFYKFPVPSFLGNFVDNPMRRRIQRPEDLAIRHGLTPGIKVLEIGPGSGSYTIAAASRIGPEGLLVAIDIDARMVENLRLIAREAGLSRLKTFVGDAHHLAITGDTFDAATLIAVIGKIPEPRRAMAELYRVLAPGGTLAFSELLFDPDCPRKRTVRSMAEDAGFLFVLDQGNLINYTLLFSKPAELRN
jgi:SAM-dependent methyltransferase